MSVRTKEQIAQDFKDGKIDFDTMQRELGALTKRPFRIDVGDKGWLKLQFDGFRFPVNLSLEQAEDVFSDEGVKRIREFIAANRKRFKVKAD
jgi:hypothetical protein